MPGHSDIDTPPDDPKCWSSHTHSCYTSVVRFAHGDRNGWPRRRASTGWMGFNLSGILAGDNITHTARHTHPDPQTTVPLPLSSCKAGFPLLKWPEPQSVHARVPARECSWVKALVQYWQTIHSALLDNQIASSSLPYRRDVRCLYFCHLWDPERRTR